MAPALRELQPVRESGSTGLDQFVSCDCSLQNSKNDFPDNVPMACAPVSGVPLLTGQLAVTSGISERLRCSLYYG